MKHPALKLLSLLLLTGWLAGPSAPLVLAEEEQQQDDGRAEPMDNDEAEPGSAESRRDSALSPPIWSASSNNFTRARGSSGPRLFPQRLGPIAAQEPPAPMSSLSAQACNACHGELHDQWRSSGHSTASSNPVYLAALKALGDPPECQDCHLPLANQRPYLHLGPGSSGPRSENPSYSPTLAQEGVTCAACHIRDGVIYGPRELHSSAAPHPVAQAESLRGTEACSYCHQLALQGAEEHPFLDTVGEWLRSPWGEAEIPCQECHMPRVSGQVAGARYAAYSSHGFLRQRDPQALRRALTLEVALRSPELERGSELRASATLLNTGAGHAVPTGDPSHRLELRFELVDAQGNRARGTSIESHWMGREVQSTPPFTQLSDTRLQAASSRVFDYRQKLSTASKAGRFTLVVSVHWWAVAPERAKKHELDEQQVRVQVLEQRIPVPVF